MGKTHINAFINDARDALSTLKDAVADVEQTIDALTDKVYNPEQETPVESTDASKDEKDKKSVKYK